MLTLSLTAASHLPFVYLLLQFLSVTVAFILACVFKLQQAVMANRVLSEMCRSTLLGLLERGGETSKSHTKKDTETQALRQGEG